MHELYELKDKLCNELKKYSDKEVTKESLEVIDTLAHATKNLDKIIEVYDEEGSYGWRKRMTQPPFNLSKSNYKCYSKCQ